MAQLCDQCLKPRVDNLGLLGDYDADLNCSVWFCECSVFVFCEDCQTPCQILTLACEPHFLYNLPLVEPPPASAACLYYQDTNQPNLDLWVYRHLPLCFSVLLRREFFTWCAAQDKSYVPAWLTFQCPKCNRGGPLDLQDADNAQANIWD